MAELDITGPLALEGAQALVAGVEAAEARLGETRERLARAVAEVEADWSRLDALATEAAAEIAADTQELFGEGTHTLDALQQLRLSYERLGAEAAAEKEQIDHELEAFAARLREIDPTLQRGVGEAEQAAAALRGRAEAVGGELRQALAETEAALSEGLAQELQEMEEAIRQRREAIATFLEGEAIPAVNTAVEELLGRLQGAESVVREALEAAERVVVDGAQNAVDEVAAGHEQILGELTDQASSLQELLEKLNTLAKDGGDAVERDGDMLTGTGREVQEDLSAVLGLVKDVEETLRRYSFVHF